MARQQQDQNDFFNDDGDSKTAFNSSLDIIQRISRYEYSLGSSLIYEDYRNSFKFLRLIYSEIDFKLKDDDIKEIDEFVEELKKDIEKALLTFSNDGVVYIKNPALRDDFIERLYQLKRVLNRLKYQVGLGMTDLSDPKYALLNG